MTVTISDIEIANQIIGVADTGSFNRTSFSGILALGPPGWKTITGNADDVVPRSSNKKDLKQDAMFSLALSSSGGKLSFGRLSEGVKYEDRWVRANVLPGLFGQAFPYHFYWNNTVNSTSLGHNTATRNSTYAALIDSGALVDMVSASIHRLQNRQLLQFPCFQTGRNVLYSLYCNIALLRRWH